MPGPWMWWAGDNDERYSVGPCATRQDAIDEALGQGVYLEVEPDPPERPDWTIGVYVIEARSPTIEDVEIDGDDVLEMLETRTYEDLVDPEGDGNLLAATDEQRRDLSRRLTRALHEWVVENGIGLAYASFRETRNRNEEYLPHPDAVPR